MCQAGPECVPQPAPVSKPKGATAMMQRRKEVMVYHVTQTSLHTAWGTEMPMCLFGSHLPPEQEGWRGGTAGKWLWTCSHQRDSSATGIIPPSCSASGTEEGGWRKVITQQLCNLAKLAFCFLASLAIGQSWI